jgi:Protein of unknown function (DUF2442)
MRTQSKTVRVMPYGRLINRMSSFAPSQAAGRVRVTRKWQSFIDAHELGHLLVAFSNEVDEDFVEAFREKAAPHTKLLLLNDSLSNDRLLSRMVDLQIRSAERFYVVEAKFVRSDETKWEQLLRSFLERLSAAVESEGGRIFDAILEDGILRVVSPDFQRLEVPISKIEELANVGKKVLEHFEIDDDGAYVYWPDLDLHLGWEQLLQVVDPESVRKAQQKSRAFNERYGAAIRTIREEKGLGITEIPGLSGKQLRRIERGECRLTSSAAKELAKAHEMTPNEYLQKVAEALSEEREGLV